VDLYCEWKPQVLGERPVSLSLCSPQISHWLISCRNRAFATTGRPLTTLTMAWTKGQNYVELHLQIQCLLCSKHTLSRLCTPRTSCCIRKQTLLNFSCAIRWNTPEESTYYLNIKLSNWSIIRIIKSMNVGLNDKPFSWLIKWLKTRGSIYEDEYPVGWQIYWAIQVVIWHPSLRNAQKKIVLCLASNVKLYSNKYYLLEILLTHRDSHVTKQVFNSVNPVGTFWSKKSSSLPGKRDRRFRVLTSKCWGHKNV